MNGEQPHGVMWTAAAPCRFGKATESRGVWSQRSSTLPSRVFTGEGLDIGMSSCVSTTRSTAVPESGRGLPQSKRTAILASLLMCAPLPAAPPSAALSGGVGTVFNAGKDAYSMPHTNLTRKHRREFVVGNSFFKDNWVTAPATPENRDGLGPLFHARSCSACHVMDGRGSPPAGEEVMTGLLLRLSIHGKDGPEPDPVYGGQLAVRAVPGALPEADAQVTWTESEVVFSDGESVKLRRPAIKILRWHYGDPAAGLMIGPRLAPPVYGGGLLEAVANADIEKHADPDDKNADGISGRVNRVWDGAKKEKVLGRFGWKANQPTLRQQAAEAFNGDLGITSLEHPDENHTAAAGPKLAAFPSGGKPEAEALILDRMESYLRGLGVPARRKVEDPVVLRGETLFRDLNCTACHLPETKTGGDYAFEELRNQTIHPYTDLLLHDMGAELADGRPDGDAGGTEWRTAPLWGIGLNAAVNGNTFFLHDGRARNFTEAVLWHGGEAAASREAFKRLSRDDRAALVTFLESL
jgi:CxxC motif-containing protein (DUF1111 family)